MTEGRADDSLAVHRFYHVFHEGEMKSIAAKTDLFDKIDEVYDDGNYVLFLTKK